MKKSEVKALEMCCTACGYPTYGINFTRVKRKVYHDNGLCPPEEHVENKPKKLSKTDYGIAFDNAFKAARRACDEYEAKHPGEWYPCGFAWVVFDGRDPAVKYLKEDKDHFRRLAGDKGYPKGWHIWNPSNSPTQCMEAKLAGAKEFCRILNGVGIDCYADSRMD